MLPDEGGFADGLGYPDIRDRERAHYRTLPPRPLHIEHIIPAADDSQSYDGRFPMPTHAIDCQPPWCPPCCAPCRAGIHARTLSPRRICWERPQERRHVGWERPQEPSFSWFAQEFIERALDDQPRR